MAVYLFFGLSFGFAAAIQPGPFQTFLISRSLNNGWRSTLPAAFAPLVSDIPIILLVLLLLSRVPAWMQNFLYLAGGLFLLYLSYGAFRSFRQFKGYQTVAAESGRQNLFKAAFVNLLNPNPYLEWSLVMGPLLLKGWRETPGNGVALVGGFYFAIIVICAGIILLFASIRRMGVKVSRALIGISAIALAGFGLYQLWLGVNGLWFS